MKDLKVIYRKNNRWFTGKINDEGKLRKAKQITKLADAKHVEDYVSLKKYIRVNKKTYKADDMLEKFGIQSLYVLYEEPVKISKVTGKVSKSIDNKKWWSSYNKICKDCVKECKQSSRVEIISCQRKAA